MDRSRWKKITGVGPSGALISIVVALVLWVFSEHLGHPEILRQSMPLKILGGGMILVGAGLHVWSYRTLQSWWDRDQLCTRGPFRYFRHPMYAAWISCIAPGFILWLNDFPMLLWVPVAHPVWHWLVRWEEAWMTRLFGRRYLEYAERTGRFFPRIL